MQLHNFDNPKSLEDLAGSAYTSVFELLHTGISIMSAEGYFLYSNKAFLEMFNLPADVYGKHVSDFFLTAEQGVMTTIRTRKMTICSSVTNNNAQGVSFRYPLLDDNGKLLGVIIESISTSIDKEKLLSLLETVRNLEEKVDYFERKSQKKPGMLYTFDSIVGESDPMEAMKKRGRRFARSNEPILLFGESGTGKELIAQALHSSSERAGKPFVTVNCAALPHDLMESELFGYGTGAFTGAKSGGMKGKFELADKGTIFLDEIGETSMPMQAKLLRVLESGEIQKIAHSGRLHSDFRLIAATNKNLAQLVEEGTFREDLYHRLNILELDIPPLRERISDIPLLTRHFIGQIMGHKRAREIHISNELYRVFGIYPWRGNVRELKNVLTSALYTLEGDGDILTLRHLPERFLRELRSDRPESREELPLEAPDLAKAGAQAERKTLMSVLASTEYNKTLAARVLGISRNKLYKKMRDLGLRAPAHES
ncbi:MAG: sigma 54-interacting transcriptional regulator [Solidesulfovibrio sp.]|uniref:sigma-54 interaction domain-containing protein n=1 Tax=Solidesulfovibrio sp. TaxID=2910990 RepID=UPI002B21E7A5|nr:sigma 54-interacting transcriptional regulator [Solidesulfovibrio sp.]MEA4858167.1 sigma 54-interacting transcriptional regulator [Solidesulfovibrio sp.]